MKHSHPQPRPRTVAEVIAAIGDLMRDCHHQSLDLQDAVAGSVSHGKVTPERLRTFQSLDHLTQVHADLARLLPALSTALQQEVAAHESLATTLRLASLRVRLFGADQDDATSPNDAGDVSFF